LLEKTLNPNLVQKSLSTNLNLISHFDSKTIEKKKKYQKVVKKLKNRRRKQSKV